MVPINIKSPIGNFSFSGRASLDLISIIFISFWFYQTRPLLISLTRFWCQSHQFGCLQVWVLFLCVGILVTRKKTPTSFGNWSPYLAGIWFTIYSYLSSIISPLLFTLGGWALSCNGSRIRSRGLVKFLSKYKLIIGQAKKKRWAWSSASFSLPGRFENSILNL